jgi:hypothetical protein
MLLVRLLMLTLAGLQSQAVPVSSDTAKWPRFRDEAHRLSFAYLIGLHSVVSPAEELRGLGGWVSRVVLVADDPGGTEKLPVLVVSVFVCDDPALDPRVPCRDENFYRNVCDRFEKLPLGDAIAIQCVTYGRAACQWSAVVLREKGRVEISACSGQRCELEPEDKHPCGLRGCRCRNTNTVATKTDAGVLPVPASWLAALGPGSHSDWVNQRLSLARAQAET